MFLWLKFAAWLREKKKSVSGWERKKKSLQRGKDHSHPRTRIIWTGPPITQTVSLSAFALAVGPCLRRPSARAEKHPLLRLGQLDC